jgi:hypothetical protein
MKNTFLFLLLLFAFFKCVNNDSSDKTKYLIPLFFSENKVNQAFNIWGLNIQFSLDYDRFKKNRITQSINLSCQEPDLKEYDSLCSQYSSLIGACILRYNSGGEITESVAIVKSEIWNSNRYSNFDKTLILAHEIGHCFGLKHVDDKNNIMYPVYEKNIFLNFEPQRTLLKNKYLENKNIDYSDYFENIPDSNEFIKMKSIPVFYVNPSLI